MQKLDILKQSLEQARRWRCPPHWQPDEWREELIAVAWAALWEGLDSGICSEQKLQRFIVAALMKRYRDEWNYGVRWTQMPSKQKEDDDGEGENGWDLWDWVGSETEDLDNQQEINWLAMVIRQAISRLTEEERYLIERKFWDGATERELAKELGISQPAVNKRLKQIYERLRAMLE
ncbi:MAG: sigma-70 family RNA polymerase sigma factor [Armatimonadota bacterium]|nr:sigma-70 family RNA polymerase sigma factor [Armatimonadota bacterium]MDW8144491.1 sigma-70 family RNA polymerase sigma factor [Armatimonadota bacterium]